MELVASALLIHSNIRGIRHDRRDLAERNRLFANCEELLGKTQKKLAERVGVQERDFAKPNEVNGFADISCNRNDLAFANLRQRLRPFAGLGRFS
jgi:hypothetical protein